MQKAISFLLAPVFELVGRVVEKLKDNTETNTRNEAKRLMLCEPALVAAVTAALEKLHRLEGTVPGYDPTMRSYRNNRKAVADQRTAVAKATRALQMAQHRRQMLERKLKGQLDAQPGASARTFGEWLSDTFARLTPSLTEGHANDLDALREGISNRIAEVKTIRETLKSVAQTAVAKRLGDVVIGTMSPLYQQAAAEYFRADRELVRLEAELLKTYYRWFAFVPKQLNA